MKHRRKLVDTAKRPTPGSAPGQVEPASQSGQPTIRILSYGPGECEELDDATLEDVAKRRGKQPVLWVHVTELGDRDLILRIGELFDLHRLALEDTVNTYQRPKVNDYDDYLFLVLQRLRAAEVVGTEQIAIFLGGDYIITFQGESGDGFEPVRQRIRLGKGRIRANGPDYLCYALIDAVVDEYFPALEALGERAEDLEDEVVNAPDAHHVSVLHDLKRDLLMMRRAVWPHRELVNALIRDDHNCIKDDTRPYLRDCYDHTVQLMDIVETYREIVSGLVDVYMSSVSVKLNEVMKTLTIFATIFMPLSFIASLYGMNFDRQVSPWNMPELGWYLGYPFALSMMLASAGGLLWHVWRKGWLTGKRPK